MPLIDNAILLLMGVNVVIAIALVGIYLRNYRVISSRLTLGLLLFAAAFLVENLANLHFYTGLLQQGIYGLTTFHLVVNSVETIALLLMAWVTWK